jgi:hypothetical protein
VVAELGGDGCFLDEYAVDSIKNHTGKPLTLRMRLLTKKA